MKSMEWATLKGFLSLQWAISLMTWGIQRNACDRPYPLPTTTTTKLRIHQHHQHPRAKELTYKRQIYNFKLKSTVFHYWFRGLQQDWLVRILKETTKNLSTGSTHCSIWGLSLHDESTLQENKHLISTSQLNSNISPLIGTN